MIGRPPSTAVQPQMHVGALNSMSEQEGRTAWERHALGGLLLRVCAGRGHAGLALPVAL